LLLLELISIDLRLIFGSFVEQINLSAVGIVIVPETPVGAVGEDLVGISI